MLQPSSRATAASRRPAASTSTATRRPVTPASTPVRRPAAQGPGTPRRPVSGISTTTTTTRRPVTSIHRTAAPVHRTGAPVHRTGVPVHRTAAPAHRGVSHVHHPGSPTQRTVTHTHPAGIPQHVSGWPHHRRIRTTMRHTTGTPGTVVSTTVPGVTQSTTVYSTTPGETVYTGAPRTTTTTVPGTTVSRRYSCSSPSSGRPCHTCGATRRGCTTLSRFAFNSAELNSSHKSQIRQLAENILAQNSNAVSATGHTDSSGTEDYNEVLGEKRAAAVVRELKKQMALLRAGSQKKLFWKTDSRGETRPVSDTDAAANRRVSICVRRAVFNR